MNLERGGKRQRDTALDFLKHVRSNIQSAVAASLCQRTPQVNS